MTFEDFKVKVYAHGFTDPETVRILWNMYIAGYLAGKSEIILSFEEMEKRLDEVIGKGGV